MSTVVFVSGIALSVVLLSLLAWKWCVKISVAVFHGIIIGALTGFLVSWIESSVPGLNIAILVLMELCFIFLISSLAIIINFYRDPERVPPETEKVILSPADGRIVYVNNVEKGTSLVSTKGKTKFELMDIMSTDLITDAAYLVGIDMNILNIHVNRAPIEGNILLCKRTRGKFISLRRQESEISNERVSTIIDNGKFKVGVIQISSRLVRRINTYIKKGDILSIGQRLGAIVFGSQVDVVLPEITKLRIEVSPGDEVKAGVSVIARYE